MVNESKKITNKNVKVYLNHTYAHTQWKKKGCKNVHFLMTINWDDQNAQRQLNQIELLSLLKLYYIFIFLIV